MFTYVLSFFGQLGLSWICRTAEFILIPVIGTWVRHRTGIKVLGMWHLSTEGYSMHMGTAIHIRNLRASIIMIILVSLTISSKR